MESRNKTPKDRSAEEPSRIRHGHEIPADENGAGNPMLRGEESSPRDGFGADAERLDQLRELLVGIRSPKALQELASEVKHRLDDPNIRSQEISEILPAAIQIRSAKDDRIGKALIPAVEGAIADSVRRNPRPLADAIFPIIGPAIRKSIANAINSMVQGLNQTLEHSLTPRGIKWRMEAARTGVPFAEVVLLHSLKFRVEQVYLIHSETSLLLQHVVQPGMNVEHADVVGAMLSAIRDFVQDSFAAKSRSSLDHFQIGGVTVLVAHGPHAYLAAVVRGVPPRSLHEQLQVAVEKIHLEQGGALSQFAGDLTPFELVAHHLESCLIEEVKPKRTNPFVPVLLAASAIVLISIWAVSAMNRSRERRQWESVVASLNQEPGIVIVDHRRGDDAYIVMGLKDPLARDPEEVLGNRLATVGEIQWSWNSYSSHDAAIVAKQVRRHLNLDGDHGVDYETVTQTVTVYGELDSEQVAKAKHLHENLSMVRHVVLQEMQAQTIRELESRVETLCHHRFRFEGTEIEPNTKEQIALYAVIRGELERIEQAAKDVGREYEITFVGHAAPLENEDVDLYELSQQRAEWVVRNVEITGLHHLTIKAIGVGADEHTQENPADHQLVLLSAELKVQSSEEQD